MLRTLTGTPTNRPFALVAALAVLTAQAVGAGAGTWTRTGPDGGRVNDVVLSPTAATTVYAGTAFNGAFRSTDAGATWTNPGGEGVPGLIAEMVGGADGALYAALGSGRSGIFKSTDGGATWTEVNDATARSLAVDSAPAPTVYAGVFGRGVLKSTDGGATWSESDTGIEGLTIQALAVDPTTPTTIYAGTSIDGVYKSTDGGATWSAANTGIENSRVREVVVDPGTPATLYAATSYIGIRKSIDAGANWDAVGAGPPLDVETLALDPVTPATLYAGAFGEIWKSVDGAANWSSLTLPVAGVRVDSLLVDPTSTTTVYAGTGAGVLKSSDGGTTWAETNSGLQAFYPQGIVVDPATPTTVYAASNSAGIVKSTDNGVTWVGVNNGLPSREIENNGVGLAIAPSAPQTLYTSLTDRIYKTTDGGATWSDALLNPAVFVDEPFVTTIAVDPADADIAFAGNYGILFPMQDFGAGFYRTTDGGTTWQRVYTVVAGSGFGQFQPTDMVVDPSDGDRIYAGALYFPADPNGWGVLRSIDGGSTWQETLTGPDTFRFPDLAVDPLSGAVYATVESGNVLQLFRSLDHGATWTELAVDPGFSCSANLDLFGDPSPSAAVFLNCLASLHLSTDGGTSWQALPSNGFTVPITTDAGAVRGLASAGTTPRTLHAATFGGIYSFTADLADLAISKSDGLSEVLPGPLTYTIEVNNGGGPDDVVGATVSDTLSPDLTCTWSCLASGGTCTATPPPGDLLDTVDLPAGSSLEYTATCTLAGGASGTLTNTATVQPPGAGLVDYVASNDSATDTTLVLEIGACGEFDKRHLTNQIVNTTLVVKACTSIRADQGFVVDTLGIVTFISPETILGSDFSALGTFEAQNAVP